MKISSLKIVQAKITIVLYVGNPMEHKCLFGEDSKFALDNRWKFQGRGRRHASRSGEVPRGNIFCWWGGFTLPKVRYFLVGKHTLFGGWAFLGEEGM